MKWKIERVKIDLIIDDLKNFLEDKMRVEEIYESEDKITQCKNCKNFDGHTTTKEICVECRLKTISGTRYNFEQKKG